VRENRCPSRYGTLLLLLSATPAQAADVPTEHSIASSEAEHALGIAEPQLAKPSVEPSVGTHQEDHPPGLARLRFAQADVSSPSGAAVPSADSEIPASDVPVQPNDIPAQPPEGPGQPTGATTSPTEIDAGSAPAGASPARIQWRLAPILWSGDIGYEARMTRNEDQGNTLEQLIIANLRGRSYIWQPWFVQVRGGLGLVLSRLHTSNDTGSGVDQSPVTTTGNVGLTVFPVSRFPFDASYEVTDSRTSGEITSIDYTNKRLSLRQSYTTPTGGTFMSARYERSVLESDAFGRDRVDSVEANLSHAFGNHSVQLDAGHSLNERDRTRERTTLERLSLRDSYRPNPRTSIESQAYVNTTDYDPGGSGSFAATGTRTAQLNSFATWRPSDQSKLYLTGSLRALALETESGDEQSDSRSLNASLGANYQYSDYTRLLASLSVNESKAGDSDSFSTAESAGVSYTPAFIALGNYLFSWSASASLANQTTTDEPSRQALTGAVGYNLLRNLPLSGQQHASANFGQTVSNTYDTETGEQIALTSSAGISWSRSNDKGLLDYASATLSDSRSWGDLQTEFQLLNVQATRQALLSALSSWSGNVTIQAARQRIRASPDTDASLLAFAESDHRTLSYSVNLTYQHQRAFGIRNLRFLALATANSQQLESRRFGDINAPPERVDASLELRFDYLIGRLIMRLSARTAEIAGRRQDQILFRITRYFGTP